MRFTQLSLSKDRKTVFYKVVDDVKWWNPFSWGYPPLFYGQMPVDDFLNLLTRRSVFIWRNDK